MLFAIQLIDIALQLFVILIFARAIISWFRISPYNPIVQVLHTMTEPVLAPIRRLMPQGMMMDFSPLIVIIVIAVLRQFLRALVF
jgi:YggT family protein